MGRSAAEAQQFHNSRLQGDIQSSRLPESRFNQAANTNQENDPNQAANTNQEYPDNVLDFDRYRKERQQAQQAKRRQMNGASTSTRKIKALRQAINKTKEELTHHKKMLANQLMPASLTVFATVPEILSGGTIGLVATGAATAFRWNWYVKQNIEDKIALRKQMIISSAIGMIPVVGVFLQGDVVSAVVLTPRHSMKEIKRLSKELETLEKELLQAQSSNRRAA